MCKISGALNERGETWGETLKMVRIAICDDNQIFLVEMRKLVERYICAKNINYYIAVFVNGEALLYDIEETGTYDIVFMDIEMGHTNGIKTAGMLKEKYPTLLLIFVSGYNKYYKQAFDVQPFQFLDKPINKKEFYSVCDRAIDRTMQSVDKINFLYNRIYYSVETSNIIYLESEKRIITAVCRDRNYNFYDKLENIEKCLGERDQRFLRIHKSFLINTTHIKEFRNDSVLMSNEEELFISREKRKVLKEYFSKTLINFGKI